MSDKYPDIDPKTLPLCRIIMERDGKRTELYARIVQDAEIYGFVEVTDMEFESRSDSLADPGMEAMAREMRNVSRSFIPVRDVVRIDEFEPPPRAEQPALNIVPLKIPGGPAKPEKPAKPAEPTGLPQD